MSDRDHPDDIIKNEATRQRRAWIERARAAMRRRLDAGEKLPEAPAGESAPRPDLRVVPTGRKR